MIEIAGGTGLPATVPRLPALISYQLRVGQMNEVAVISYGGKVFAFRDFFGVLLLLDFVCGDVDVVVVLQGQLHGLVQGNVASGAAVSPGSAAKARTAESTRVISNSCDFHFMSASP